MPRTDDCTAAASDAATFAAIDRIVGEFDAARAARTKKKPKAAAGRPAMTAPRPPR